jgi:hypothetical protein
MPNFVFAIFLKRAPKIVQVTGPTKPGSVPACHVVTFTWSNIPNTVLMRSQCNEVKVKVKLTLEQATKGEQMYSSTLPSTLALDGVDG